MSATVTKETNMETAPATWQTLKGVDAGARIGLNAEGAIACDPKIPPVTFTTIATIDRQPNGTTLHFDGGTSRWGGRATKYWVAPAVLADTLEPVEADGPATTPSKAPKAPKAGSPAPVQCPTALGLARCTGTVAPGSERCPSCEREGRSPAPKAPKAPKAVAKSKCECGCGKLVSRRFAPGHDARLKGQLIRTAIDGGKAGEKARAELESRGWTAFLVKSEAKAARVAAKRAEWKAKNQARVDAAKAARAAK